MMRKVVEAVRRFFANPKCVFWLGLVIVLTETAIETLRGRATNYYDYADSTLMFWSGISPYSMEFVDTRSLYFLYTPVFTTIFAPIFLLPRWLGPFVWNIMNYVLLALAIHTLPKPLAPYRHRMFLFLFLLILQSLFCFQYNMVVLYIFLFAFTLLERGKPFWAVLLIMVSATTKVYGIVELALLLCYPKFWRNLGYAVLCGVGLLLLPAINPAFDNILALYAETKEMIFAHHSFTEYPGLLFARGLSWILLPHYRIVQIGVLAVLAVLFFWRRERWGDFRFRVQALAVLMGYIILLSDSPETHTYIIALTGYLMAFWLQPRRTWIDWTLFWLLFVNFCILPTDVLCPVWLYSFFHNTFWLDIYCMTLAWLRVIWWAVGGQWDVKKVVLPVVLLMIPMGMQAQSLRFKVKGETFMMKPVKGGSFLMGALDTDTLAEADERPRHRVTVADFYIGETEVTQELWKAVMGKNPAKFKGEQWPVERISYDDCQRFISKLNALTGHRFRLPTEAEWEYAARGGNRSRGYLYAGSNDPRQVAWLGPDSLWNHHAPVASRRPNELGLYDMSGGVWEWCDSSYDLYDGKEYGFLAQLLRRNFRVIRGGGFRGESRYGRVSNRYQFPMSRKEPTVGLRLALSK